jgi:hypothetical protein
MFLNPVGCGLPPRARNFVDSRDDRWKRLIATAIFSARLQPDNR